MEKHLIPKLRFPEFNSNLKEVGFTDLGKIMIGLTHTPNYLESGVIFLSSKNISKNYIDFDNVQYISKKEFDEMSESTKPKKGDILFTRVGSNLGNPKVLEEDIEFAIFVSLGIFRVNEKATNYFVRYWMDTQFFWKQIEQKVAGGAKNNLNSTWLREFRLNLPSLPEQQKIASFLTDVDDKITKLTKKKDLLEQYKKGIMQKIFNQELRFKDDNGNNYPIWVEKKLDDLGSTLNGLTGKTKENFGSGKPYIQYKQIFDSSKINIDNCGLVDITITDKQTTVQYGDVFFTTSSETPNEIGTASVLLDSVDEMYLNSFCFGFRVNQSILYPSFSQFLFRSSVFRKKMIPLAQGSTRYNISKSSFLKLKVHLPTIEEQIKIANFLSDIDLKIEVLNTKIENSKSFKKGLLQQMFV